MPNDRTKTAASARLRLLEEEIGIAAGRVWQTLKLNGSMSGLQIAKVTGMSPDAVHRAVGWLAREDKLMLDDHNLACEYLRLK